MRADKSLKCMDFTVQYKICLSLFYLSVLVALPSKFRTDHYTFLYCITDECQNKYGNANAWRYCCRVFDLLTIAAVSGSLLNTTYCIVNVAACMCRSLMSRYYVCMVGYHQKSRH